MQLEDITAEWILRDIMDNAKEKRIVITLAHRIGDFHVSRDLVLTPEEILEVIKRREGNT